MAALHRGGYIRFDLRDPYKFRSASVFSVSFMFCVPLGDITLCPAFPCNLTFTFPTSNTMHVALQMRDILHEIFEYLNPLPHSHYHEGCEYGLRVRSLKALHASALVCKAFSEPALKRLWMHVSKFDALLGLLPSSARVVPDTAVLDRGELLPETDLPNKPIRTVWVRCFWCTVRRGSDKEADHGRPHR